MKPVFSETFHFAELYIRQGLAMKAQALGMQLLKTAKHLTPFEKIKLGNIFNRCGFYSHTLKLLHGPARVDEFHSKARMAAKVEYSAALVQLGLTTEASEMLSQLDHHLFPETLLNQALMHFQEWNYEAAIPFLEKFVGQSIIDEYRRIVGQLNLFVAYSFVKPDLLVWKDIEIVGRWIESQKYFFLMGIWSQIAGRYFLLHRDFVSAALVFSEGLNFIKGVSTWDSLYLQKWDLVCAVQKSGPSHKIRKGFEGLKALAKAKGDFETIRDCDFLIFKYFDDFKIGKYCFRGTPFPSFRARFNDAFTYDKVELDLVIASDGIQYLKPKIKLTKVDLMSDEKVISAFEVQDGKKLVKGNLLALTLRAMLLDFYRPMTAPGLFNILYKGDHWNPQSSPLQIRQVLCRIRQWIETHKIPLRLCEKNSSYRLCSEKRNSITIYTLKSLSSQFDLADRLLEEFEDRMFSFQEFRNLVSKNTNRPGSLRTHRRWMNDLHQRQKIVKIGNTKSARFKNKINQPDRA